MRDMLALVRDLRILRLNQGKSMENTVDPHYQREAKDLTNLLFDKGFLNEALTRESIDWLEDYLGFVIQTKCELSAKTALLTKKAKTQLAATKDITL